MVAVVAQDDPLALVVESDAVCVIHVRLEDALGPLDTMRVQAGMTRVITKPEDALENRGLQPSPFLLRALLE